MTVEWPGVVDSGSLTENHVASVTLLADAARAGRWDDVFGLLDANERLSANQWRIGGRSLFAPLHQAAWLGAPVDVVAELIRRGGWRSLRTAEGDRPIDLSRQRGHGHLTEVLAVRVPHEQEQQRFAAWDRHLAELISARTERVGHVSVRPVPTELIALEPLEDLYFGYPGMYGGFSMSIFKDRLFVESSSRVVGGSGQAHVITEGSCVLVEEGFD
ncbi:hypothetical protein [Leucobacter luti]|uniref:Uncharacterized protein n=1 Tax=Leucobacter luti TaxID=340320 RepID=A0A4Q7TUS7_9MICO|nr:hypothetical protein [Leucobacter luti]MBL3698226.1 hypothetical protein [Leucobacter luti]RZT64691.1 hypothetical protein EV139_2113 [Leucobacter luti]